MKTLKKKLTNFRSKVRSRHPSHSVLRDSLPFLPFKSVIRLGSTTPCLDDTTHNGSRIECNTIQSIKNSSNKYLMKKCFEKADISHANWYVYNKEFFQISKNLENGQKLVKLESLPFPLVAKHRYGSRGTGNTLIKSLEAFKQWISHKELSNYIFEEFYSYTREYRLHITSNGCFYTCRKLLKNEYKNKDNSWQRHDDNCIWVVEANPSFNKPTNWNTIIQDCVKALNALGLDIAAFDVKVQSSKHQNPKYIIIESNSAPSFGDITTERYLIEIPKILKRKYENSR